MKLIKYILVIIFILLQYIGIVNANIDLTISPIKYEISTNTGTIITKVATLLNSWNQSYIIETWKSDFESRDDNWSPYFVRKSELVFPWQSLSEWINVSTENFSIDPWETKEVLFTITVPGNATPGWYYWAVFFKNNNTEIWTWSFININVDYWILLLVTVEWEVIKEGTAKETIIINENSWWWDFDFDSDWYWSWGWESIYKVDDCTIDLTSSRFDWKCIDLFFENSDLEKNIDDLNLGEELEIKIDDFNISFETLFENEWNIHIKPKWSITLIDENWKIIKWIWKEVVKNDNWAVIWHEIVDYVPINDNWWSVLPWTDRNFKSEWKWFPYKTYDSNWDPVINYWTPEEYYTKKNIQERTFLYPWERINERLNHEKIKADINFSYIDNNWKLIEFNSAKEFYIDYKEQYIGLNPYALIFALIFIILWILFRRKIYIIFFKKIENRCINKKCNEIIKKDIKVCPYCKTKQYENKYIKHRH